MARIQRLNSTSRSRRPCATRRINTSPCSMLYTITYSPTGRLREPEPKSLSRVRPIFGWVAMRKNRAVMESIRRLQHRRCRFPWQRNTRYCPDPQLHVARDGAPSALGLLFRGDTRETTLLYCLSKLSHGFFGDDATFAACERRPSVIES